MLAILIIFIHNKSTYIVCLLLENVSPPPHQIYSSFKISITINWTFLCNYFIKVIYTELNKEEIITPLLQIQKPSFQEDTLFKPIFCDSKIQVLSIPFLHLVCVGEARKQLRLSFIPGRLHPLFNQPVCFFQSFSSSSSPIFSILIYYLFSSKQLDSIQWKSGK